MLLHGPFTRTHARSSLVIIFEPNIISRRRSRRVLNLKVPTGPDAHTHTAGRGMTANCQRTVRDGKDRVDGTGRSVTRVDLRRKNPHTSAKHTVRTSRLDGGGMFGC